MRDLLRELVLTMRVLTRDRSFSLLVILMLGVGIAANATSFSVLDAVLLRPLPFAQPERLVQVIERTPEGNDFSTSEPNFLDLRARTRTLQSLGAHRSQALDLTGSGEPQRLAGAAVSASFFRVLGVAPQLGRTFNDTEDVPGGARVVVLSDALWRQHFGGQRTILEQSIALNGTPHTVVGVMPVGFTFPEADAWVPLAPNPAGDRGDHWLTMVGRLRADVDLTAVQSELEGIMTRIGHQHPPVRGWSVSVGALQPELVGDEMRAGVWMLAVAVALFLLLTCANVANLFVARTSARTNELALRAALGASRTRLASHMLLEALVLAVAGGLLALLITTWSLEVLRTLTASRIPGMEQVRFDARLIGFTLLATLITSALFGMVPALRATRTDVYGLIKSHGRAGVQRQSRQSRELLVAAQIGLATVLLLGSGLLVRSVLALQRVDPGFSADSLIAVPLELTGARYHKEEWRSSVFFQQLSARVQDLPGVLAAGATTTDPFRPFRFVNDVTPVERAAEVGAAGLLQADWRAVTPGYFKAAGVQLLHGRLFEERDRFDAPRVGVITAELARKLWPGQSAVGHAVYWGGIGGDPITIVGVVHDIRDVELGKDAPPMLFLPTTQLSMPMMTLLVRTTGSVDALAPVLRRVVWSLDPGVPVPDIRPVSQSRALALARPRLQATLMSGFATLALLIAVLGVYALVSFQVASRTRELGIRFALGAQAGQLHALVLRRTSLLVAAGLLSGIVLTVPLAGALSALLFQTAPFDAGTFLSVSALLAGTALLAAYLPARRITQLDPLTVLRQE